MDDVLELCGGQEVFFPRRGSELAEVAAWVVSLDTVTRDHLGSLPEVSA